MQQCPTIPQHDLVKEPAREPPPPAYPGHYRQLFMPGFRQSFSGSEASTDMSLSSMENLSTSARQDPQGEEACPIPPSPLPTDLTEEDFNLFPHLMGLQAASGNDVEIKANNSTFYVTGRGRNLSSSTNDDFMQNMVPPVFCMGTNMYVNESYQPQVYASGQLTAAGTSLYPNATYNPGMVYATDSLQQAKYGYFTYDGNVYQDSSRGAQYGQYVTPDVAEHVHSASYQTNDGDIQLQVPKIIKNQTLPASLSPPSVNLQDLISSELTQEPKRTKSLQGDQQVLTMKALAALSQKLTETKVVSATGKSTHTRAHTPSPTTTPVTTPKSQSKSLSPRPLPKYQDIGITQQGAVEKTQLRRSYEMLDRLEKTRSQPDLTRLTNLDFAGQLVTPTGQVTGKQKQTSPLPGQTHNQASHSNIKEELDHAAIATRATQMVESLSEENRYLRQELDAYCKKVSKLQKLERELQKVHDSYENLVKRSNKRENLEKVMHFKRETEIKKLKETNRELKEQLEKSINQLQQKDVYNLSDSELRKEVSKKDSMITTLLGQNKELTNGKERLDIEVAAQQSTLQEQRAYIDILDSALANAQANIMRLDDEIRKKQAQEARFEELEKIVAQLQTTSEKREAIDQKLRGRLEDEIKRLRRSGKNASSSDASTCMVIEGEELLLPSVPAISTSPSSSAHSSKRSSPQPPLSLQDQLEEREQHILRLEAEAAKWEQCYLEESALKQMAIDAASMPKDVRIAALEQSSVETERIIGEARTERLKHLEEVYQANRKSAELEARVKTLQAQLAEKEAMIGVLHRHPSLSRCSSISSLLGSPNHSPHPSILSSSAGSSSSRAAFLSSQRNRSVSCSSSAPSSRQNSQLDPSILAYIQDANSQAGIQNVRVVGKTDRNTELTL